jgi:hypothetical protein
MLRSDITYNTRKEDFKMNADKIRGKIVENRMSIGEFCKVAGFNRATFDRKMSGRSEFTRGEIERISSVLNLTDEEMCTIFFENVVA